MYNDFDDYNIEEEICGETVEHLLINVGTQTGETLYLCKRCDAELVEGIDAS